MTGRPQDDQLTALALAAGRHDRDALAALVRGTQADVWRFCASLNGRDEADDLTQETFARAIGSLHSFSGASTARTWLLAIARRVAADAVRGSMRRRRLIERVGTRAVSSRGEEVCRSGEVDLMELVAALEDDRREAFVLTQLIGLDYEAASEVVGCPIGTIRSRVARARRDLVDATEPGARAAERSR